MPSAIPILGGIGLFLIGAWMMTEGLKLAAGGLLQRILASATSSPLRGLAAGIFITALVRSSSAVTVATIGFVNAGLLALAPAVWVVFGTNIGTTTTAWLVVLAGTGFEAATMGLPLVGIGMILRLAGSKRQRMAGLGQAIAGFGVFFLGIGFLQDGFDGVTPMLETLDLDAGAWLAVPAFVLLGFALTVVTQSSSAAIAIALTASAGGSVPLALAASAVIGTNIGTTSTAAFAALGATAPARRVAAALRALAMEARHMADIAFEVARVRIGQPEAARREVAGMHVGALRLGKEIRTAIGRLGGHTLPDQVSAALPDIIRGVQHLEEVLRISGQVEPPERIAAQEGGMLAALRAMTLDALRPREEEAAEIEGDGTAPISAVEEVYQKLKAELLVDAGRGRLAVAPMEAAFLQSRLLRRIAEEAHKARRRLSPWSRQVAQVTARAEEASVGEA